MTAEPSFSAGVVRCSFLAWGREDAPPMDDPFLNYFALFLLIFAVTVVFYAFIAIRDVPYRIAKARFHPHRDAIRAAGWVSLLTLHALWPFLWIWAMVYRSERGWAISYHSSSPSRSAIAENDLEDLRQRVEEMERKLDESERTNGR